MCVLNLSQFVGGASLSVSMALQAAGKKLQPAGTKAALSRLREALAAQSAAEPRDLQLDQLLHVTGKLMQLKLRGQQTAGQQVQQMLQQLEALISGWQRMGTHRPLVQRLVVGAMLQQGLLPSSSGSSSNSNASDDTTSSGQVQSAADRLVRALFSSHVRAASAKGLIHFMHVSKSAGDERVAHAQHAAAKQFACTLGASCMVQ